MQNVFFYLGRKNGVDKFMQNKTKFIFIGKKEVYANPL
jgi:hypothetical protein